MISRCCEDSTKEGIQLIIDGHPEESGAVMYKTNMLRGVLLWLVKREGQRLLG